MGNKYVFNIFKYLFELINNLMDFKGKKNVWHQKQSISNCNTFLKIIM